MSLRSLIMPLASGWLLSESRLASARARAERTRQARSLPHEVHYFHQVDDPYSALACQALAGLQARYGIRLVPHLVSPPADDAAPDRPRLVAYSRRDAAALARRHGLHFTDPGCQPCAAQVAACAAALSNAIAQDRFTDRAPALSRRLWADAAASDRAAEPAAAQGSAELAQALAGGDRLRRQLGHYLGATFFYGGEWYWGIDRLHHLERRLQALAATRSGGEGRFAFEPDLDRPAAESPARPLRLSLSDTDADADAEGDDPTTRQSRQADPSARPPAIDFFFSLRSPYSAIVMPRVFALARHTGAPVRLRFLLPMVMRGLAVPANKRRYIALDVAREARLHGAPFGRINDPLGRPTERGLALIPWAHAQGRAEEYLLSFMQGVWAEGLDAGSDRGLARIVLRAGLPWAQARQALHDDTWRVTAERNRQALLALGLWGVPSFHVEGTPPEAAAWGQDRLWQVRQALHSETHS